jgi:hypothetical protein
MNNKVRKEEEEAVIISFFVCLFLWKDTKFNLKNYKKTKKDKKN